MKRFYCTGNGQMHNVSMKEIANTLDTMHDAQITIGVNIYANSSGGGISSPLDASYFKGTGNRTGKEREYLVKEADNKVQTGRKYVLRRLTPVECARLQGFPDWWCDGTDGSDSSQYKLWGNGIALPCAVDVLGRIVKAKERGW